MKKLISLLMILSLAATSFSQTINPCGTYEHRDALKNRDRFTKNFLESQQIKQQEGELVAPKGVVYTIPIVFHILHDGGESNISREQVLDGLRILNEDYKAINPDINVVSAVFDGWQTDAEIEFVLATKAPNGECFSGITRTYNPTQADNGSNQWQAVRNGNDVYQGEWPGDEYLNVFVVKSLDQNGGLITLGYTSMPGWGGTGMDNGFFVRHDCVGSIGTGGAYGLATPTHEIGHWLNLPHTWGNSNNPGCDGTATNSSDPCWNDNWWAGPIGPIDNCEEDDFVDDTPACIGTQGGSCDTSAVGAMNSCDNDNAYWGFDIQDMRENYMDYAHCDKMFSPGQIDRMRNALQSSQGGRNNLWTPANLAATGADSNLYICKADFTADRTSICAGDSIQFFDESFNAVNGWSWTFNGGNPATSTDQNPVVIYNTPGFYEVELTATDGVSSEVETKTAYIRVLPDPWGIPVMEGFEPYTSFNNLNEWEVVNDQGNTWEITSTGLNSNQSAKLVNYGQPIGTVDELISAPRDLSSVTTNMTLSFRYAYKRRNTSDDDWLRVYTSSNCGDSWEIKKTLHGFQLTLGQAVQTQSSQFTPSSAADWTTVHMTNITSQYWVQNFRYKFNFEAGGGNNFYLDNINIYEGNPSDDLIVGVEDMNDIYNGFNVFPNPASNSLNIQFDANSNQGINFEVVDVTGKVAIRTHVLASAGNNLVVIDTENLSTGLYFLKAKIGSNEKVMQFVKK